MVKRRAWLSVTPEPERELPLAAATLRSFGHPSPARVEAERARIERLLLRGTQRRWIAYLREVLSLIEACQSSADPFVREQRARAVAVIANHHNLLLGLPGRGAQRTAPERTRLNACAPPQPRPNEAPHEHR